MVKITIYSKKECHLCDNAKGILQKMQREFPFSLAEIDIEKNSELFKKYKHLIPVIEIDGEIAFNYKINEAELRKLLIKSQPQ